MKMAMRALWVAPLAAVLLAAWGGDARGCTSFRLKSPNGPAIFVFNMELPADVGSRIAILPRGTAFTGAAPAGRKGMVWKSKYGIVGADAFGETLIGGGMNEKGLGVSMLYLPSFTTYQEVGPQDDGKIIGSWQAASYLLSQFATVAEAREGLAQIKVSRVAWEKWGGIAPPVHFRVDDPTGACIVVEYVDGKLNIHDNPLGVMTNSPTFDWHMINLRNYMNLSATDVEVRPLREIKLAKTGVGSGMIGLPGDGTPPSRFVRAVALTQAAVPPENDEEALIQAINISHALTFVKGLSRDIVNGKEVANYTQWTLMGDLTNGRLYFRTYDNADWKMVDLKKVDFGAAAAKHIPMKEKMVIPDVTAQAK